MGHQFVGLFSGCVQTDGMIDVVLDAERRVRVGAVHGARRCVHEVRDVIVTSALENVGETDEVGGDVGIGVGNRIANPDLRGQMNDRARTGPLSDTPQRGASAPALLEIAGLVKRYGDLVAL